MKKIISIIAISCIGFVICFGQDVFEYFSEEYVSSDVQHHTLLVLKYRELSVDEAIFNQDPVKYKVLLKFVSKENAKMDEYNRKLERLFKRRYEFPYKIIDEKELVNYSSEEYPFLYKRYAQIKNEEFIAYSRFFMNRKEKKLYKDLNLFASNQRERLLVEKDIVYALNDFLIYGDSLNPVNPTDTLVAGSH